MGSNKALQRCVGAAALLLVGYTLFAILWPMRYSLLLMWVVVEVVFYIMVYLPRYESLNAQPAEHRPGKLNAVKTFNRFLRYCRESPAGVDYEAYFSGWFRGVEFKEVKRGNAEELMAYGFWYRTREQMQEMGCGHVPSEMIDQLEAVWGVKFERGYNPTIRFRGHLWEPLNAVWHPLAFYMLTEGVGWAGRQLLKRWGFQQHHHNGLAYFTLNVAKPKPQPPSITSSSGNSSSSSAVSLTELDSSAGGGRIRNFSDLAAAAGLPDLAEDADAAAPPTDQDHSQQQQSAGPGIGASNSPPQRYSDDVLSSDDWTPFRQAAATAQQQADDGIASAAAAADREQQQPAGKAAGGGCTAAGARSSSSSLEAAPQDIEQEPGGLTAGPASLSFSARLAPQTSMLLGSTANPLQEALSGVGLGAGPPAGVPVLFLHGIGGLPAYLELVLYLMGLANPVIAVEFKHVSMRLGRVFSADEVVDTVVDMLDNLAVQKVCVVAHSYGTFIAGLLVRRHPERVATTCLIDPVCFGMFHPHLLANFLYRDLTWTGWRKQDLAAYAKVAARKLLAHEVHLCATCARRFYWSDLNLWPEDLPVGSVVLLSGKDDLMDSGEVKHMLDRAGHVQVMYNQNLTHGAFLLDVEVKAAMMDELRALLARSGSAVVGLAQGLQSLVMPAAGHAQGAAPIARGGRRPLHPFTSMRDRYQAAHPHPLVSTLTGSFLNPQPSRRGAGSVKPAAAGSGGNTPPGAGTSGQHQD